MTCKDCIHWKACRNTAQELHIPIYARYLDDKED